jgi:hypothetical protein
MVYDEQARRRQEEEMRKWGGSGSTGSTGEGGNDGSGREEDANVSKRTDSNEDDGNRRGRGWGFWTHENGHKRWTRGNCPRHRNHDQDDTTPDSIPSFFDASSPSFDPAEHVFGLLPPPILFGPMVDPDLPFPRDRFPTPLSNPLFHHYFPQYLDVMSMTGPAWPIPYILFSSYSPLNLERRLPGPDGPGDLRFMSKNWRDAFEDLMRTQTGKEMLTRSNNKSSSSSSTADQAQDTQLNGGEWIRALIARGSIGDWKEADESSSWTSEPQIATRVEELDRDEDPPTHDRNHTSVRFSTESSEPTEMDMYESLWGLSEHSHEQDKHIPKPQYKPNPPATTTTSTPTPAQPTTDDAKSNSIISTLTTTTRTLLPDGSVQTKVVLKKRFGDGREEVKETELLDYKPGSSPTSQPQSTSQGQARERSENGNGNENDFKTVGIEKEKEGVRKAFEEAKGKEGKAKKRGWFWN